MLKRRALSEHSHLVNEHCGYGARLLNAMLTVSLFMTFARFYLMQEARMHRHVAFDGSYRDNDVVVPLRLRFQHALAKALTYDAARELQETMSFSPYYDI